MREIQKLHGEGTPGLDALRRFVKMENGDFIDEKLLLAPLLDGAGVLYVVDPGRPLHDDFLAEMEILRWTGCPRLALLNRRSSTTGPDEEVWKNRLGGSFNLVRTFDAHHARYDERLRLLKALLEIEERHRPLLERTIELLEDEWRIRREEAAERMINFFHEALPYRVSATLEERDLAIPERRERKAEILSRKYFEDLATMERRCFEDLLRIYRHHLLKADTNPEYFSGIDLKSEESWTKWGLNRLQLIGVASAIGASAGLAIDIGTVFFSHGAGTALGALIGGGAAWFKGGSLPDLRITLTGGIKLGTGDGKSLKVGPPKNPNFPWILLDGILIRYRKMLSRAHGRRDEESIRNDEDGVTRSMATDRRALLGRWFGSLMKSSSNRSLEPDVYKAFCATLAELENRI